MRFLSLDILPIGLWMMNEKIIGLAASPVQYAVALEPSWLVVGT